MKKFSYLVIFLLLASLFSGEVNRGDALKVAKNVFNEFKPASNNNIFKVQKW